MGERVTDSADFSGLYDNARQKNFGKCFLWAVASSVCSPELLKWRTFSQQFVQAADGNNPPILKKKNAIEEFEQVQSMYGRDDRLACEAGEDSAVDGHLGCRIKAARRFV